jgi:NADH:ubiquinone oxidoreductase subunit F (NADH-binding)
VRASPPAHPTIAPPATESPRLLCGLGPNDIPIGIREHLSRWGSLPSPHRGTDLIEQLEASGLAGHGGAWFPTGAKWRSVRDGGLRRPVVVANGAEGEPASSKDALLLARLPHLVLDGASLAAAALAATRVVVYAPERLVGVVEAAIGDRRRLALDPVEIEVVPAPDTYIAGQESAVVNALNQRAPVPTFIGTQPIRRRGVNGRPTLVQNVETLAHVALIARFGPAWFRGLGSVRSPGTMLLTVTGRWSSPRIVESPLGIPLRDVLRLSDGETNEYRGVLLGGYGGGWIGTETALNMPLVEPAARQLGTSLGAGVVVLLHRSACPLAETAHVVRYLERQRAGQCGPCVNGLSELADLSTALATKPSVLGGHIRPLLDVCDLVEGRGACRHPDGAARLVRSALDVFADEVTAHLKNGSCHLAARPSDLPGLNSVRYNGRKMVSR